MATSGIAPIQNDSSTIYFDTPRKIRLNRIVGAKVYRFAFLIPKVRMEKIIEPKDLGHDKLLTCLYFLWDAFQHGLMVFFLTKDTAKYAIENVLLYGDHIDIGVRKNEWDVNWGLLQIFLDDILKHVNQIAA